jgi:hypothetical protein
VAQIYCFEGRLIGLALEMHFLDLISVFCTETWGAKKKIEKIGERSVAAVSNND